VKRRRALRSALVLVGLFSGLLLKVTGHVLIALGVPDARQLVRVAHVLIVVFGVAVVAYRAYEAAVPRIRRRNARKAVETAAAASRYGERGAVQAAIGAFASSGLAPGVACAVAAGGERWIDCAGEAAEGRPVVEHAVFDIGSLTKVFTGILLADMANAGEVALEDPLRRFFPELAAEGAGRLTLLDLATHTAGLPRIPPRLRRRLLASALAGHRDLVADPYADLTSDDVVAAVAGAHRARPGFRYSNLGFAALGLALSRAAGAPYEILVEQRVCEPLGLRDTAFRPREGRARAQGHDRLGRSTPSWRTGAMAPAAGLTTTAPDLLLFAEAAMRPADTALSSAVRAAQQPRRPASKGDRIGLGWLIRRAGGRDVVWHNGGTGGFGSCLAVDCEGGAAVGLLANAAHDTVLDETCFALLEQVGRAGEVEPLLEPTTGERRTQ
jgi:D-alanyl-D-alanine-carboxypeptidase/D-alanyl-D-alanine-endopeptidase